MHLISTGFPTFSSLKIDFDKFKDKITRVARAYFPQVGNISKDKIIHSLYEIRLLDESVIVLGILGALFTVKKIISLLSQIKQLKSKNQELEVLHEKQSKDLQNKNQELEDLKNKQSKDLESKNNDLENLKNKQIKQLAITKNELELIKNKEIKDLQIKNQELEDLKNKESKELQIKNQELEDLQKELITLNLKVTETAKSAQFEKLIKKLQESNTSLKEKINVLNNKITELEASTKESVALQDQTYLVTETLNTENERLIESATKIERASQTKEQNFLGKIQGKDKEIENLENTIKKKQEEINALKAQLAAKVQITKPEQKIETPPKPQKAANKIDPNKDEPTDSPEQETGALSRDLNASLLCQSYIDLGSSSFNDIKEKIPENVQKDHLFMSVIEESYNNPELLTQLPIQYKATFLSFFSGFSSVAGAFQSAAGALQTTVTSAKSTATANFLTAARYVGSNYAYDCFTKNAPRYKIEQVSHTLANLVVKISEAVGYQIKPGKFATTTLFFSNKNFQKQISDYLLSHLAESPFLCSKINNLIKLLDIKDFSIEIDEPAFIYIENAPEIRHKFLMKLEDVVKEIKYEEQINDYIASSPEDRIKNYSHIHLLHIIAKHLTEAPIWDQATDHLNPILGYNTPLENQTITQILQSDIEKMKARETAKFEQGSTWESIGVNFEKTRMMVPGDEKQATNYRNNFSSLLGTLISNQKTLKWLAMGTPSLDGGTHDNPAELSVLYRLYLDHLTATGESLSFFGLQKCPKGKLSENCNAADYEKNRTEAFTLATLTKRWKNTFSFTNLSLDQVTENKSLALKDPNQLHKKEKSDAFEEVANFTKILKALMLNNEAGFWGLKETVVTKAISTVTTTFFPSSNYKALNDKQRWSFLMLTYAMIILQTSEEKKSNFHFGCKDNIDRGAVLAFTVKLVTEFRCLADKKLSSAERQKIINNLRTMLHHRADYVKGQAVIPSRAPLAFFVADHIEELINAGVSENQLKALPAFEFMPFEASYITENQPKPATPKK